MTKRSAFRKVAIPLHCAIACLHPRGRAPYLFDPATKTPYSGRWDAPFYTDLETSDSRRTPKPTRWWPRSPNGTRSPLVLQRAIAGNFASIGLPTSTARTLASYWGL
jgi:hypothetical protein